ncbi:unnamed protein product, partial [Clonostachys solani]
GHNIAIAILPDREYSTTLAAVVVRDLIYSFLNVCIRLIVGIRGGIPSLKYGIYLSDMIAISSLKSTYKL